MKKSDQDKLKIILNEVKEISDKIQELKPLGEIKKIKRASNSAHITMGKEFIERDALVIILPKLEDKE